MITQPESGLTQEQYDAIRKWYVHPTYQVIAQRYAPVFEDYLVGDAGVYNVPYAAHMNEYAIWVGSNGTIAGIDGEGNEISIVSYSDYRTDINVCFVTHEGVMYFYFVATNNVVYERQFDGEEWTVDIPIGSVPADTYLISASRPGRIHGASRRVDDNWTTRFFVLEDGAEEILWSEIYWAHVLSGFSAVKVDERRDCIVISTPLPAIASASTQGTSSKPIVYRAGGLVSFLFQNNKWSDHHNIEIFDDTNIWLRRSHVTASALNGYIFAVAYSADGNQTDYTEGVQIYRSKNGKDWEQSLPVISRYFREGAYIGQHGDHIYLSGYTNTMRAVSTDFFGYTPEEQQYDITQYIQSYNRSFGSMAQGSLTIINELNRFVTATPFDEPGVYMLRHYWGYVIDGEPVRVLVGTDEVEVRRSDENNPERLIIWDFRDRLAWMTDRVKAHHVRERETPTIGADDFESQDNTGYGGMRHTAQITGSWRTENNRLLPISNDKLSVAHSTYRNASEGGIWSGSIQVGFKIPTLPSGAQAPSVQKAGVVFRAHDAANYWYFVYDKTFNLWRLGEVRAGVDAGKASYAESLAYDTFHYVKVVVRYQKVTCYQSDDGYTWNVIPLTDVYGTKNYYIMDASSQGTPFNMHNPYFVPPVLFERGFVGYIAQGYSNRDNWSTGAFDTPTYEYNAPGYNPEWWYGEPADFQWDTVDPGITPSNLAAIGTGTVYMISKEGLLVTNNFGTTTPTWDHVVSKDDLGVEKFMDFEIDPFSPKLKKTGSAVAIYLLTDEALYYCSDVTQTVRTWDLQTTLDKPYTILRAMKGAAGQVAMYCASNEDTGVLYQSNMSDGNVYALPEFYSVTWTDPHGLIPSARLEDGVAKSQYRKWNWMNQDYHSGEIYMDLPEPMKVGSAEISFRTHGVKPDALTGIWVQVREVSSGIWWGWDAPPSGGEEWYSDYDNFYGVPDNEWHTFSSTFDSHAHDRIVDKVRVQFEMVANTTGGTEYMEIDNLKVWTKATPVEVAFSNDYGVTLDQETFGSGALTGNGMDVDDWNTGIILAAGNDGKVYAASAYGGGFTALSETGHREQPINGVRVWFKRYTGLRNDANASLHALVTFANDENGAGYNPNTETGEPEVDEYYQSARRTETKFSEDAESWKASDITPYSPMGQRLIAAGANAYEAYGNEPRTMAFVGYVEGQKELAPGARTYYFAKVVVGSDGKASFNVVALGSNRYDMVMFSPRNKQNLYACGYQAVGFSKNTGSTWIDKLGNLSTLLGSLPHFTKIVPLIVG